MVKRAGNLMARIADNCLTAVFRSGATISSPSMIDVLVQGSYNKGREEKRIDNARKMKSLGVDVSIISQVTGLTA